MIQLRPHQEKILEYSQGLMGISAVPGSGKTLTLSYLAAEIIASGVLAENQEVLIVTLVTSAVDNFYQRIWSRLKERALIPTLGYRVRTLHGLAHDIVRERPDLVNLSDRFTIVDERESASILREVSRTWIRSNPGLIDQYLSAGLSEDRKRYVRDRELPEVIQGIANSIIRLAKDWQVTPDELGDHLHKLPVPLPLAVMGYKMFSDYQNALAYRGGVDFDDLIRLALRILETDSYFLERLRDRWPYILEDEAQDSSRLQELILSRITGKNGNWVRVGDPNQAIFETFTTADPKYLRNFIQKPEVISRELPVSGRSCQSIIYLANQLVSWAQKEHPIVEARDALQGPPFIQMTEPNDPDPNPLDNPAQIHLSEKKYSPDAEVRAIAISLERWLPDNQDKTVAVLVPRNKRAEELIAELESRNIEYVDSLLKSSRELRDTADVLQAMMTYFADPLNPKKLSAFYRIWYSVSLETNNDDQGFAHQGAELILRCQRIEEYISPEPGRDWLLSLSELNVPQPVVDGLYIFRDKLLVWQEAVLLPVDQMLLMFSRDIFKDPVELALAHKLARTIQQLQQSNLTWNLPQLADELRDISRNRQRLLGFSQDDIGFDPKKYKGKVVVSTIHKAKGLEWDRVYLMSVNNYDFPSGDDDDRYFAEKWYMRDGLNLDAETLAQFEVAISGETDEWYQEGEATLKARLDYIRERLRLLYVGITRAKSSLVITWNSGRDGKMKTALPLLMLIERWNEFLALLEKSE